MPARSRPAVSPAPFALDATDRFLRMFFVRSAQRAALVALAAAGATACSSTPLYGNRDDDDTGDENTDGPEGCGSYRCTVLEDAGPGDGDGDTGDGDGDIGDGDGDGDTGDGDGDTGDGDGDNPIDAGPPVLWNPLPCGPQSPADFDLGNMTLSEAVDFVAIRQAWPGSVTSHEHGVACDTALQVEACRQELLAIDEGIIPADAPCDEGGCTTVFYGVTTRGDDVKLWKGPERLRELLGSLDTPSKAALWLHVSETSPIQCGDATATRSTADGTLVRVLENTSWCDPYEEAYVTYLVEADGTVTVTDKEVIVTDWESCVSAGRRPEGLVKPQVQGESTLARFFARVAHLEAASVPAFEALERELVALGAPARLLQKVREAIADEREHARVVGALSRRFGAEPCEVECASAPLRDTFALALDNAVEGCVRETFGAALATFQARHARDPEIRAVMERVAQDETRHAGFSWQLAAWLDAQLSAEQRACVREAQLEALAQLREELLAPQPRAVVELAGMPDTQAALVLLADFEDNLLRPALAA